MHGDVPGDVPNNLFGIITLALFVQSVNLKVVFTLHQALFTDNVSASDSRTCSFDSSTPPH